MSRRLLILTEGHTNPRAGKTASSLLRYKRAEVVALLDSTQAGKTVGEVMGVGDEVPIVASLDQAPTANTLLIGIAPAGGKCPPEWKPILLAAIERGLDVVAGLHDFLGDDPELAAAAKKHGVALVDVRKNQERDVAQRLNIREDCLRIQTIGHDCSVGKMVTAIEITQGLKRAGHDAKFVATGQTGIMIEGDGCPVDCVVADFINGAVEKLILTNQQHDFLLVEGQGSLCHPRYSSVTAGLLHGAIPQGLILCYECGRDNVGGMPHIPIPPLTVIRDIYESMATLMSPAEVIGVAMNSRTLSAEAAAAEREQVRAELGLPVCDVIRDGADELVQAVLELRNRLGYACKKGG